jgi:integrase
MRGRARTVTPPEVVALFDACSASPLARRDSALLWVGYVLALSPRQAVALRDDSLRDGALVVPGGGVVYLSEQAAETVGQVIYAGPDGKDIPGGRPFPLTARAAVERLAHLAAAAGLEDVRWRGLRRAGLHRLYISSGYAPAAALAQAVGISLERELLIEPVLSGGTLALLPSTRIDADGVRVSLGLHEGMHATHASAPASA